MRKLFILILIALISPSYAVRLKNLYEVQLPVASQMADIREEAVRAGLLSVLIRLTGNAEIENNPEIQPVLTKADYYVEEYTYLPVNTDSDNYLLRVQYESKDIKRLLKKSSIAYWDENRPLILVWLTFTNSEANTEIIANEGTNQLLPIMREQSKKFGLPIIFPMMDVADLNEVSTESVLNNDLEALKNVSSRYASDGILIGHINATTDSFYSSEWKLTLGGKSWEWTLSDHELPKLVHSALQQITEMLVKRYNRTKSLTDAWLHLKVNNVNEGKDLTILTKHLATLPAVQKIELAQVLENQIHLLVMINTPQREFQENLNKDSQLAFKSQNENNNELTYEWLHN